ncbi:hypothetical protein [Natronoglycomyces albus]|uniref:Uncharacterized protein n=1 Tax=Natronoglycomyces albus TaxID=2811108 RepID=A0A895XS93_9ACTN|nr:hypothetical protein [Natronoglycomyces albus]QSB05426.1 hypothetical protein JQS30_00315 [Natronoglycomyces albus]
MNKSNRFIQMIAITTALVVLAACSSSETGPKEWPAYTPPQAPTPGGIIDVCQHIEFNKYRSIKAHDGQYPGLDLTDLNEIYSHAACRDASPGFFSSSIKKNTERVESGNSNEDAVEKYFFGYVDLLGVNGLAATWNNMIRHDEPRSLEWNHIEQEDRDFNPEALGERKQEFQEKAGLLVSVLTSPRYEEHLKVDFTGQWIELGSQVVQTRSYTAGIYWYYYTDDPNRDPDTWEVVEEGPQVYGWSILAPLLRFGDFDESFLVPVATAAIEFDQELDGDWRIEGEEEISFDLFNDDTTSSIDAILEALSRNPEAAQAVYDNTADQRLTNLLNP